MQIDHDTSTDAGRKAVIYRNRMGREGTPAEIAQMFAPRTPSQTTSNRTRRGFMSPALREAMFGPSN